MKKCVFCGKEIAEPMMLCDTCLLNEFAKRVNGGIAAGGSERVVPSESVVDNSFVGSLTLNKNESFSEGNSRPAAGNGFQNATGRGLDFDLDDIDIDDVDPFKI